MDTASHIPWTNEISYNDMSNYAAFANKLPHTQTTLGKTRSQKLLT